MYDPGGLAVNVVAVLENPPPLTLTVAPPSPAPSAVTTPDSVPVPLTIAIVWLGGDSPAASFTATTAVP